MSPLVNKYILIQATSINLNIITGVFVIKSKISMPFIKISLVLNTISKHKNHLKSSG